tara:strand:+ start:475 stop:777 length:303 start_codon:yes stop_codon:yes gene_type:complete
MHSKAGDERSKTKCAMVKLLHEITETKTRLGAEDLSDLSQSEQMFLMRILVVEHGQIDMLRLDDCKSAKAALEELQAFRARSMDKCKLFVLMVASFTLAL